MSKCIVVLEDKVVLYQRERSSVWQARIKLDDGKWHRASTKEKEQHIARERALELFFESRARSQSKLPQVSRNFRSVAKLAIQQMEDDLKEGRGKVVYKAYISSLTKTLIPYFGNTKIDNITPAKLDAFAQWRREQYEEKPPASTITNHNSALGRIFDIAVQYGWATRNSLPQLTNKGKKSDVRPTFSFQEYRLLVRRMREWMKKGHKKRTLYMRELLRDYVLILSNTGIRHGTEAMNLKWKDIDWYVNQKGDRFLQMTVDGKTGNRQLICRHHCVIYLTRIKNRFDELKDLTLDDIFKRRIDEYVFRLRDGTRTNNLHQSFAQLMRDTDLMYGTTSHKPRTLYSLRHFYATYQLFRGTNIHQLAIQMGTSVGMLEKHYSKLTPMLLADEFAGVRRKEMVIWG